MRMQVNAGDCFFDSETLDGGEQMPIMKINFGIKFSVIDLMHALDGFQKQHLALEQQQLQLQQPPVYTAPPPPPPIPLGGFDATTIPHAGVSACAAAHVSGVSVPSPALNMDVKRGLSFTGLSAASVAKNAVERELRDALEIQAAMCVDALKDRWEAPISSLQANYPEYASNGRWTAIDDKFATINGSDVFSVDWKPVKLQLPRLKQVSAGGEPQIKAPIIIKAPEDAQEDAIPQQVESTSEMPASAPPGSSALVSTCTEVATASVAAVSSAQAVPPDSSPAIDVGAQEDAIPQQVESTSEMPDSAPPGSSALVSTCPEVATAAVTAVSSAQALPPDSSPSGVPASSALDAMDRPVSGKSDSVLVSDSDSSVAPSVSKKHKECSPQ